MLIKNAKIYGKYIKDIKIENGKITQIDNNLTDNDVLNADGLTLLPSFIDFNVRLKDQNFSINNLKDLEELCIKSGISHIILKDDMFFDDEIFDLFLQNLKNLKIKIFSSVNALNKENKLRNLAILANKGAIAYELLSANNANILRNVFQYANTKNLSIFINCYDKDFDDNGLMNDSFTSFELGLIGMSKICEISEVAKIKQIAKFYNSKVVYDLLSVKESFDILDENDLTQVSIHNVLKDDLACDNYNTFAKLMPPLRSKEDVSFLQSILKNKKIKFLSSAHCPISFKYKDLSFDDASFGIDSLQEYLSVCYTFLVKNSLLDWEELCEMTSLNQAKFLNLNSGKIEVGKDANLILIDENENIKANKYSLYKEDELFGSVKYHLIDGKIVN